MTNNIRFYPTENETIIRLFTGEYLIVKWETGSCESVLLSTTKDRCILYDS